ncbi:MAG TPA: DinB family protein [Vicinamibacteria bacterium]
MDESQSTRYAFLVDTYRTERLKVMSVWSMFEDADLAARPHRTDRRGRSVHEHMVHQCTSEDMWFRSILGIDVGARPLPETETRLEFIRQYSRDSAKRLEALRAKPDAWWEEVVAFFESRRMRAWIVVRRIAHTAHHRGQQTALARILGRDLYSTYGPTADTGGLGQHQARTIYAYPDESALLEGVTVGGRKRPLPGPGPQPPTERPDR